MDRRAPVAGLFTLVAALAMAGCDGDQPARRADPPVAASSAGAGRPADERGRAVTLAFAGDVHFQLHLAALLDQPRRGLGPVSRTLREADLAMVNLESAITGGGSPDPKELEVPPDRYWFRTSPAALDLLAAAGVDVVTMANNHGADYGLGGLADTLRAVRRSPIPVVGVGRDRAAAFTPYRVTIDGTSVAVFGADTSAREGMSPGWEAGAQTPGIAAARGARTRSLLTAVRRAAARDDVVVVYLHWGIEGQGCPGQGQLRIARDLAGAGADVVVGSHAHLLQGAGWLGDTYVGYGLGNFVWYHNAQPDTGVLRLRVANGRVVSDEWVPAVIQPLGRPVPLRGRPRAEAVARWLALRACAGLSARPGSRPRSDAAAPPQDTRGYAASVHRIGPSLQARMDSSHGSTCPVPWSDLRLLRLPYVGFDGTEQLGELVVAARYARDVVGVFARLYEARWPIRQMRPVSDFGGNDGRSMAADNTSAYNCRRVARSDQWSAHAYGAAVDVNPVENPYVLDGEALPPVGRFFAGLDRTDGATVPAGTIRAGDVVVEAFAAIGWEWGGSWADPDYQHFVAESE